MDSSKPIMSAVKDADGKWNLEILRPTHLSQARKATPAARVGRGTPVARGVGKSASVGKSTFKDQQVAAAGAATTVPVTAAAPVIVQVDESKAEADRAHSHHHKAAPDAWLLQARVEQLEIMYEDKCREAAMLKEEVESLQDKLDQNWSKEIAADGAWKREYERRLEAQGSEVHSFFWQ
jgi:hypothetical protein